MIWILGAAFFVFGAVILTFGLRRARRGSDPHCAKCHHNLSGLKNAAHCPECGADLARPRAVKPGAPYRRLRWAAVGLFMLVVSLVLLIAGGYFRTDPAAVMPWLPDWAVAMQATGLGDYEAEARTELMNRLNLGALGEGTVDELVAHALAVQADRTVPWDGYWGNVVETAHRRGMVSPESWQAYIAEGMRVPIRARKRVRPGDRLPIEVKTEYRFGSLTGEARFMVFAPVPEDWQPDLERWPGWIGASVPSGGLMTTSIPLELAEPGSHNVRIGVTFALMDSTTQQAMGKGFYTTTAPIELADDDQLRPLDEDVSPDEVRATLAVRNIRISRYRGPRGNASLDGMVSLVQRAGPTRWPLALRIFARINGVEYEVGTMAAPPGSAHQGWGIWEAADFPETIERIDIIFSADPDIARHTLDVFDYWNGEVLYENVEFRDERKAE